MLATILFVGILLLLWKICSWYYEGRGLPPGPPNYPLVGAVSYMNGKRLHEMASDLEIEKGHPGLISFRANNRIIVCVNKHNLLRELFVNRSDVTSERPYRVAALVINPNLNGLVNAPSPKWERRRRLALRVLRDFGVGRSKVIDGLILTQLQHIEEVFDNTAGEPFEPSYVLHRAVAGIICSILFGQPMDREDKEFDGYLDDASRFLSANLRTLVFFPSMRYLYRVPFLLPFLPGGKEVAGRLRVTRYLQRKIDEIKEHFHPDQAEPRNFVEAFFSMQKKDPDLKNEERGLAQIMGELFVGASDTTYHSLRWGLLYISREPEIQDRVYQEIHDLAGTQRLVNFVDAAALHYTRAVVYEVLRFGNVAGISTPHTATKDIEIEGYRIPKGCILLANIYHLLRDPKRWKNPMAFDPNNFLDEKGHFALNDAFVAFSMGRRVCPGESLARNEVFVFLASILQKYRVTPALDSDKSFEKISSGTEVVSLRTPLSFKIRAVRRD